MLSFSRPFTDTTGKSDLASFKLAFASAADATDTFLFACERVNAPDVDRTALQAHANGATGIVEVVAVSDAPAKQHRLLSVAIDDPTAGGQGGLFDLPNAILSVIDRPSFTARFGLPAGAPTELRFAAIVFSVRSVDVASRLLAANSIAHDMSGNDVVVPPASGQGAGFIFREIK
jgi:hypothetical protein